MDLAAGAKNVWIAMVHTTREGQARLKKRCDLPLTAAGVVSRVMSDLGLFDVTPEGFVLREIAPGFTPDEVRTLTEAEVKVDPALCEVRGA